MATRTITVHDRCTTPECGRVLHSISEGERGLCAKCWVAQMKPDTRSALNRLIAAAFDGSTDDQKRDAVKDAMSKLKRDNQPDGG